MYDGSGRRVPESWTPTQDEFAAPIISIEAENRVDISNAEFLIPIPPRNGIYYVNVELWDKGDEEWFDETTGYRIGGYDEWGNPEEDRSLKCRLILVKDCESAVRLSSINTEEFEVRLDASGPPRSTKKTTGSDSGSGNETKSGGAGAEAAPKTEVKASSSDPSIAKNDEKAKAEATQKALPKTGGPLHQTLGIMGALVVASGLMVRKALR